MEEAPGVLSQSEGVEASLSTAQRLLADGHLLEAAALLEHTHASTAAAPVVAQVLPPRVPRYPWVKLLCNLEDIMVFA